MSSCLWAGWPRKTSSVLQSSGSQRTMLYIPVQVWMLEKQKCQGQEKIPAEVVRETGIPLGLLLNMCVLYPLPGCNLIYFSGFFGPRTLFPKSSSQNPDMYNQLPFEQHCLYVSSSTRPNCGHHLPNRILLYVVPSLNKVPASYPVLLPHLGFLLPGSPSHSYLHNSAWLYLPLVCLSHWRVISAGLQQSLLAISFKVLSFHTALLLELPFKDNQSGR